MINIVISDQNKGQKAEKFVKKFLKNAPLSFIYKLFRKKDIKINGHWIKPDYILKLNDDLQIYIGDDQLKDFNKPITIASLKHNFDIIYEDNNILVVNKPSEILVHEDKNEKINTLANQVLSYLYEKGEFNNGDLFKPSPAHRLDRNTSGVLFFGKNVESLQELEKLFKDKNQISKHYNALVFGITDESGTINKSLFKNSESNEVFVSDKPYAKTAITEYKLIEKFVSTSLLDIKILTGRTHQIRVHMQSIGHPVVGDQKYGNFKLNKEFEKLFGLKYQLLHASYVTFGKIEGHLSYLSNKTFSAKLPEKFQDILYQLRKDL